MLKNIVEKYFKGTNFRWEYFLHLKGMIKMQQHLCVFRFQYFGDGFDNVSEWKHYVFYHEIKFLQKNTLIETGKLKPCGIGKILQVKPTANFFLTNIFSLESGTQCSSKIKILSSVQEQ